MDAELAAQFVGRRYTFEDFIYCDKQELFYDRKVGAWMTATSVNGSIATADWRVPEDTRPPGTRGPHPGPVPPAKDLVRKDRWPVAASMTWAPGRDQLLYHVHIHSDSGAIQRDKTTKGMIALNVYQPPLPLSKPKRKLTVAPWIEHMKRLWPSEPLQDYLIKYSAHMIQHPGEKANGIIVLSGEQGIGKDAFLAPLKLCVGMHNVSQDISADNLMGEFNPWKQSVMIVADEFRPSNDGTARAAYNAIKPLGASPPETLLVNQKNTKAYHIQNCCRLFITTNDQEEMYMPPGDRRIFVLHSRALRSEFTKAYWKAYWDWYDDGGSAAVLDYLMNVDLSDFDPKMEPPASEEKAAMIETWLTVTKESPLGEVLEAMEFPLFVCIAEIREKAGPEKGNLMMDAKKLDALERTISSRAVTHAMKRLGYMMEPATSDGHWIGFRGTKSRVSNVYAHCEKDRATSRRDRSQLKVIWEANVARKAGEPVLRPVAKPPEAREK